MTSIRPGAGFASPSGEEEIVRRIMIVSGAVLTFVLLASGTASAAICQTDMDCKGERICEGGQCVYPPMRPQAQPAGGYAQPQPGYDPQPGYGPPVEPQRERGPSVFAMWRKGLQAELRMGLGICVDQGDDECGGDEWDMLPGGGFGASFLVRFFPFVGVGLDFGYYMLRNELGDEYDSLYDDVMTRVMSLMLQVRGYLPFKYADVFLKISAGYSSYKSWGEVDYSSYDEDYSGEYSSRYFAPLNIKLGMGGTFFITQDKPVGDIGLGVDLDFLVIKPYKVEYCFDGDCEEEEWDEDDEDMDFVNNFQLNVHFSWVFTIF